MPKFAEFFEPVVCPYCGFTVVHIWHHVQQCWFAAQLNVIDRIIVGQEYGALWK